MTWASQAQYAWQSTWAPCMDINSFSPADYRTHVHSLDTSQMEQIVTRTWPILRFLRFHTIFVVVYLFLQATRTLSTSPSPSKQPVLTRRSAPRMCPAYRCLHNLQYLLSFHSAM